MTGSDRSDRGDGSNRGGGGGANSRRGKETDKGEEIGGHTKNGQGEMREMREATQLPVQAGRVRGARVNEKKQPRREMKQMKEP